MCDKLGWRAGWRVAEKDTGDTLGCCGQAFVCSIFFLFIFKLHEYPVVACRISFPIGKIKCEGAVYVIFFSSQNYNTVKSNLCSLQRRTTWYCWTNSSYGYLKNSPKMTIFGTFYKLLSTQNVNFCSQFWMRLFLWFSNTV